jgi:hypothetical protein
MTLSTMEKLTPRAEGRRRRRRTAKIWSVRVLIRREDGEERWELGTDRMTYSDALRLGDEHVRAGRRAQLVDDENDAGPDVGDGGTTRGGRNARPPARATCSGAPPETARCKRSYALAPALPAFWWDG